jgi:hypothetical protein
MGGKGVRGKKGTFCVKAETGVWTHERFLLLGAGRRRHAMQATTSAAMNSAATLTRKWTMTIVPPGKEAEGRPVVDSPRSDWIRPLPAASEVRTRTPRKAPPCAAEAQAPRAQTAP